jgi:hypothetical protein
MNINTTINLDDILNSNEEASSEETIEILKESIAETAKSIEENAPLPDFDAIVTEWSYRCDKGYPDMKNKSDMIKLQEILNEMGIKSPFKQVQLTEVENDLNAWINLKKGTANEKAFKNLLFTNQGQLNFENNSIYQDVFDKFIEMDKATQTKVIDNFQQTANVDAFVGSDGTWKIFQGFYDCTGKSVGGGTPPGRGEMMAVMAIKGASSGGSKDKDLQIKGGSWEIKEAPDSIRMAKSGGIGKFEYVDATKDFYKLLTNIGLNNSKKDKLLKRNLSKVFSDPVMSEKVFKILKTNFRGDEFKPIAKDVEEGDTTTQENFFDRTKTSEWPAGVIDLHYNGFKELFEVRDEVLLNKDLINNAKLILRTSRQDDKEFYINPEDSDEIATAKPGKEVKIKVATPAKGDIVEFLQNMLMIMKHPLVVSPSKVIKSFIDVRDQYFATSKIEGILYYNKGKNKGLDPEPHLGRKNEWIIYGISAGNGKMMRKLTAEKSKIPFIQAQVKISK